MQVYDYKQFRVLREVLGWSVADFVEKAKPHRLEVSTYTVENWEAGITSPDASKMPAVAATFGVVVERFFPLK